MSTAGALLTLASLGVPRCWPGPGMPYESLGSMSSDEGPAATPRRAGRVLVIDPADRVLLLQGFDPAVPEHRFWFTIGGGADPGESLAQAAARELREESGIVADATALGAPVWRRTARFSYDGRAYRQEEEYFAL